MKKIFLLSFIILSIVRSDAQSVGIGTTMPNGSSILELNSTTKGLLPPRMTGAQRLLIPTPATGLIVYQTDLGFPVSFPGYYIYDGAGWKRMARADELGWVISGTNLTSTVSGSVGIGTSSPGASAILDLSSVSKGLLIPRMTSTQRTGIVSPAQGLMVFQNNGTSSLGFWYHDGTSWQRFAKASELTGSDSWTVAGDNQYSNVDGNVGIGITSGINEKLFLNGDMFINAPGGPLGNQLNTAELKIRGAAGGGGLLTFLQPDSTSGASISYSSTTQTMNLRHTESDSYMRFYDNGNIGIGTNASFDDALAKIQIKGGTHANLTNSHGYILLGDELGLNMALSHYEILARDNGQASPLFLQHDGGVVRIGNGTIATGTKLQISDGTIAGLNQHGYLVLGETFSQSIAMDQNSIQARDNGAASRLELQDFGGGFRVKGTALVVGDDNAFVGIGVASPTARLHVGGSSPTIQLQDNFDDKGFVQLSGDNLRIGTNSGNANGQFVIRTNGGDRMFVNAAGNVGIGTNTPLSKLDVAGRIRIEQNGEALGIDGTNPHIGMWHNGSDKFYLQQLGNNFLISHTVNNPAGRLILGAAEVAINTLAPAPGYSLSVAGEIICEELRVELQGNGPWPDYVFADDYKLQPLHELKAFVATNKHLPNIPAAAQVESEGFDVGDMNRRLLEKVEELTLYIIQQQEDIDEMRKMIEGLK